MSVQRESLMELWNLNLFVLSEDGKIKDVSSGGEEVLGFDREEIVGKNFVDLFGDEQHFLAHTFLENLLSSKSANEPQISLKRKSGRRLVLKISGGYIGAGEFVINAADITDNIKLLERVQVMNNELELKVKARTEELEIANGRLEEMAMTDSLTGLKNSRFFRTALEEEIKRAQRYGFETSVLLMDLDNFKNYNDVNGHLAGDDALRQMGAILQSKSEFISAEGKPLAIKPIRLRVTDVVVARYGGEEFAVILPHTPKEGAMVVAERVCQAVRESEFEFGMNQPKKRVTVSVGVATFPEAGPSGREILESADRALYMAKENGRDTFCAESLKD